MKKGNHIFSIMAIIAVFGFSSSAAAQPEQGAFEQYLNKLNAQTNYENQRVFTGLEKIQTSGNNSMAIATSADWSVESPSDVDVPVTISNRNGVFKVSLKQRVANTGQYDLTNGPRAYEFADGSSISPIVKHDGSVQFVSEIPSAEASHEIAYTFTLPKGMKLTQDAHSGQVYITNIKGEYVGGVAPAWATDGNYKPVKTWYKIINNQVLQYIDGSQSEIAYPVIADPWLGFDLISTTIWAATTSPPNAYAPTLAVYPTDWGRTVAGSTTFPFGGAVLTILDSMSVRAAWDETILKTNRSGHPNPNTSSMYHQFECHFFYVSKWDSKKLSWNLDIKRPDGNLIVQVANKCNVP